MERAKPTTQKVAEKAEEPKQRVRPGMPAGRNDTRIPSIVETRRFVMPSSRRPTGWGFARICALAARFDAPESALHDPGALPDADRAVARVDAAVRAGERVLVLGDFDADGLTGLAILVLALRYRGLDVQPYVPARTEEGHGLSRAAVETALSAGRTLILTADTGSTSHAEIAEARQAGVEVIVTDHHQLPGGPPDAAAVINPHRADSRGARTPGNPDRPTDSRSAESPR